MITKEFIEFKYQPNLRIEFTKNNEGFKNRIFSDPRFDLEILELIDRNIGKLFNI